MVNNNCIERPSLILKIIIYIVGFHSFQNTANVRSAEVYIRNRGQRKYIFYNNYNGHTKKCRSKLGEMSDSCTFTHCIYTC